MDDSSSTYWLWDSTTLRAALISLGILALFCVASFVFRKWGAPALLKSTTKKRHPVFVMLVRGFQSPIAAYLIFAGICVALGMFANDAVNQSLPDSVTRFLSDLLAFVVKAFRIGTVLAVTWGLVASSDITSLLLRNARHKLDWHMSKSVSHFLAAVFNVVVVAIATVIILNELNFDVQALLTGLGLSGLTIALAAKDSASNFFGGLVLVTEKPFEIGDTIDCSNVQGTVEDINLRSTKIRTAAGSLTVVPNSLLAAAPLTNSSGAFMERRRADFTLQFLYSTTQEQITAFIADAQDALASDKDIPDDSITVRFTEFGESSLNVRIIFYTALSGFDDYTRIRERINFALMEIAQKHKIGFAYPTRTIYLEQEHTADA